MNGLGDARTSEIHFSKDLNRQKNFKKQGIFLLTAYNVDGTVLRI